MSTIVKICAVHGALTIDQVRKENNKQYKAGFMYRCHFCKLEKDRRWKNENREKHRASASRARNLDRTKANEWTRKDRKEDPQKYRDWQNKLRAKDPVKRITQEICRTYGLTLEQYEQMVKEHDNKCGICGENETRRSRTKGKVCRLVVDHCHGTGKVRGLLCHSCNVMIGSARDNVEVLQKAIAYLSK